MLLIGHMNSSLSRADGGQNTTFLNLTNPYLAVSIRLRLMIGYGSYTGLTSEAIVKLSE